MFRLYASPNISPHNMAQEGPRIEDIFLLHPLNSWIISHNPNLIWTLTRIEFNKEIILQQFKGLPQYKTYTKLRKSLYVYDFRPQCRIVGNDFFKQDNDDSLDISYMNYTGDKVINLLF